MNVTYVSMRAICLINIGLIHPYTIGCSNDRLRGFSLVIQRENEYMIEIFVGAVNRQLLYCPSASFEYDHFAPKTTHKPSDLHPTRSHPGMMRNELHSISGVPIGIDVG